MSWAAVGASAISAAASIYTSSQQAKAAKNGGGGSVPQALNPGQRHLNFLFGQGTPTRYNSEGRPLLRSSVFGLAEGDVFGTNVYDEIRRFINSPSSKVPGTNKDLWANLFDAQGGFGKMQERFAAGMQEAIGTASELTKTGIPTNGQAYFDEALRKLTTEATPLLAEKSGFGTQGSGFLQGGYQASQDLFGKAAMANIDLQEAATNRRMAAAPLLSTLLTAEQSVPLNMGMMLDEISNKERLKTTSLFQSLYGLGGNQYFQPGFNPISSGAGYSSAQGGLSGILGALGSFSNQGGGGGGGGAPTSNYNNSPLFKDYSATTMADWGL